MKHTLHLCINTLRLCTLIISFTCCAGSQPLHYGGCWLKDVDGSYFNPKGYVVIMEDGIGKFDYAPEDYQRMIKYGANAQVIRLGIASLAGLLGEEEKADYLQRVHTRVRLGKKAGMKTFFKMTIYDMPDFDYDDALEWSKFYSPDGEYRQHLLSAWEPIWRAYANEPMVAGYDLLNEPYRESKDISYEDATQQRLIPLYIDLINRMKVYSPQKWALYQPLLVDDDEKRDQPHKMPMMELYMPPVYDRMAFAPHPYFYQDNVDFGVKRHQREAEFAKAALLYGEWGHPVKPAADAMLSEQCRFTRWYADIASAFDSAGAGLIKPWFTGTRELHGRHQITWSVFSDGSATGRVERKYLMDVICRPYPLTMAGGQVEAYGFDLAQRTFSMTFTKNDFPSGKSEIYVPEDRHYPDGFSVIYNDTVVLGRDKKSKRGLKVVKTAAGFKKRSFRFNSKTQRLVIEGWSLGDTHNTIAIVPGSMER